MKKLGSSIAFALLAASAFSTAAQANSVTISGTLFKQTSGTTFDQWTFKMQAAGSFSVDVLAYEASQSNIATAGYFASDLNGDGELTWLDSDTYFYRDDGHLDAADAIVRCDDTANNCAVYQNGLNAGTSPVVVTTHQQAEASRDGSIHFRRDAWYEVAAQAGDYLFLMADFRLDPAEAAGGINANDNFSPPTGFLNPITDHADYAVKFSSSTLNFQVTGNTITVSAVPVPGAIWLFGSAAAMVFARKKRSA